MKAVLDHVVIWVDNPLESVAFFVDVVGLAPERLDAFRAGEVLFPSVRVNETTILDLLPRAGAPGVDALTARAGSAGHPVNHVCLAMSAGDLAALRARLEAAGATIAGESESSFGARGFARSFYFHDLDGNVLEARSYD